MISKFVKDFITLMIILICVQQNVFSDITFNLNVKQPSYINNPTISWASVSKNEEIQICWQKEPCEHIEYYNVYRSSELNKYWELIGQVDYESDPYLNDLNCFANMQSYKYKIAAVDKCGGETFSNEIFKTIFLQVKPYRGGRRIIVWNPCEGMNIKYYQIYKGLTINNLDVIDRTLDNETTYIDNDSLSDDCYYQIEAIGTKPTTSNVALKSSPLTSESSDTRSFSNLVIFTYDSLKREFSDNNLVIYPNPLTTTSAIKFPSQINETYQMNIFDMFGNSVMTRTLHSGEFILERKYLKEGIYIIDIANRGSHIKRKLIVGKMNI